MARRKIWQNVLVDTLRVYEKLIGSATMPCEAIQEAVLVTSERMFIVADSVSGASVGPWGKSSQINPQRGLSVRLGMDGNRERGTGMKSS